MNKHTENPEAIAREVMASAPISGTLSCPTAEGKAEGTDRVKIRKTSKAGDGRFQIERLRGTKAFHENLDAQGLERALAGFLAHSFTRAEFTTEKGTLSVLANRRGELGVIRKTGAKKSAETAACNTASCDAPDAHDRQKKYILPEGTPVPFLVDLGVMTETGAVVKSRYDKFRQINRFLEFIEDALGELKVAAGVGEDGKATREITVVDFGCGKSYLTFATYYYLRVLRGIPARIIGLDLKRDVIESCAALAVSYGYDRLEFSVGDIAGYQGCESADMVITLHACDTATDAALAQAIKWKAKVILSVPCCQHELNAALSRPALLGAMPGNGASPINARETLKGAFRYGIVRERLAALFTDAMRAELLAAEGYRVQILEFVDMSHTPKNLLIRAIRAKDKDGARVIAAEPDIAETGTAEYRALRDFLGASPALEGALAKMNDATGDAGRETRIKGFS